MSVDRLRLLLCAVPLELTALQKRVASPQVEVVEALDNPQYLTERVQHTRPQVVCLGAAGLAPRLSALVRQLMETAPVPILLFAAGPNQPEVFDALQEGALDVSPADLDSGAIVARLRILAGVKVFRRRPTPIAPASLTPPENGQRRVVAIGASTGGPQALAQLLSSLSPSFPLPIVCVQHIGNGFLNGLVEWLSSRCRLRVQVAQSGEQLQPGNVYFAPDDHHLRIDSNGRIRLNKGPKVDGHCPSATVLLRSVAESYAGAAVGLLLTGMGSDGAEGLRAMAQAGAVTMVQNPSSSVVYGMARRAVELGATDQILSLEELGAALSAVARA